MKFLLVVGVIIIIGLIALRVTFYIVDETEQVIILRFGEVVRVEKSPGLYPKAPLVDQVIRFEKRLLRIDAAPESMPDIDKENLRIDSYARYRILDAVQFRKTLQNEATARTCLGNIVNASLRSEIAKRDRIEIIGSEPVLEEDGTQRVDSEGLPLVIGTESRSEMLLEVQKEVKRRVAEQDFGIEIIDVRIKRADFPDEVTTSIYTRMRAERNRIASRFRAEGDEKDLRIRAEADKEAAIIRAEAQRDSERIRGEGQAKAIEILAAAHNRSPDLFAFLRSLEAYETFMGQQDTVILSADAPIFRFLTDPGVGDSP